MSIDGLNPTMSATSSNAGVGEGVGGSGSAGASSAHRHINGNSEHSPSKALTGAPQLVTSSMAPPATIPLPAAFKSEKAQGKARQIDPVRTWPSANGSTKASGAAQAMIYDDTPPEVLLAELLPQTENLVPLAAIVERMSNYGYEALQILSETLSSLPSEQRRQSIFNTAITCQRQIAKLVALALWSRLSGDLQKARDAVGLLCEQFAQAEDAVKELTGIRQMLPQSRLRNFDLISATDVFRAGAYPRLPAIIKTSAVHEKKMDDKAVDDLVEELEDAIRLRLSCHDVVPLQMSDYRIADGRAHFNVPHLFQASLTCDGPFPLGRWYLLTVRFNFRVTGAGKDRFPRVPKKQFREILLEQVNAELSPPPPMPPESDGAQAAKELDANNNAGRPPPLVKFFRHLEQRALQYQLDILAFQAGELSQTEWKENLRVERDAQTQALRLTYWTRLGVKPAGRQLPLQPSRTGGSITLTVQSEEKTTGTARSISRLLFGDEEQSRPDSLRVKSLGVRWRVDKSVNASSDRDFAVRSDDLDVGKLLNQVVGAHAQAILDGLRRDILQSAHLLGLSEEACELRTIGGPSAGGDFPKLIIRLCGALTICIEVQPITGQIVIREDVEPIPDASSGDSAAGTQADVAIFTQSKERLNRDPAQVVDVLRILRQYAVSEDIEQKACFLGLEAHNRLPLPPVEFAKLGASPDAVLFLSLPECPNWYLVAQIAAHPPRIALTNASSYMVHGQTYGLLGNIQWINRAKVLASLHEAESSPAEQQFKGSLADVDLDELAHLHWYAVALVSYVRIEQQLHSRHIPFSHTLATPPLAKDRLTEGKPDLQEPVGKVASKVPVICIRSADLLGNSAVLVKPNIFVRLSKWWDRAACSAQIVVRLSLRSQCRMTKFEPLGGSGTIEYDAAMRQLTFSTTDIDNCVAWFLIEWDRFSRIGMLVKAVERARKWPGGRARGWKVLSFDLHRTTFTYAPGRCATVTWSRSIPGQPTPEAFVLRVFSQRQDHQLNGTAEAHFAEAMEEDGANENPHECIETALEQNLNAGSIFSPGFWPSFLCLLHETLPVLEILHEVCKDDLTDASAPTLELRSACWYRLRYGTDHGLDVRYLAGSRFVIADAARPLLGPSKSEAASGFVSLPSFHRTTREAVTSYYTLARQFAPGSTSANGAHGDATGVENEHADSGKVSTPAAVDLRRAVLCAADEAIVGPILSAVLASVREQLRQASSGEAALETSTTAAPEPALTSTSKPESTTPAP